MKNPLNIVTYFTIVVYLAMGGYLITTQNVIQLAIFGTLSQSSKIGVGIVLVGYGLWRIYREIKKYRINHEKE